MEEFDARVRLVVLKDWEGLQKLLDQVQMPATPRPDLTDAEQVAAATKVAQRHISNDQLGKAHGGLASTVRPRPLDRDVHNHK